jgi:cytochrome c553
MKKLILLTAFAVACVRTLRHLYSVAGDPVVSAEARTDKSPATRTGANSWILRSLGILALVALGGFLFAASGVMSIKASSGHWAVTEWMLNFAMERSVKTHALAINAPALDDEALVLKGAGHYEIGCRSCHGAPDLAQQPRIPQWMTPHPPNLSSEVSKWSPRELFYIVKHGVKFTGMPAWPAQKRDDEVWAMVAFLLTLPSLTADDYQRLVRGKEWKPDDAAIRDLVGSQQVADTVLQNCGRCHGPDGTGRGTGAFPKLAGQKPDYFVSAMRAYAQGRRFSGVMEPIAVAVSPETTVELARYYTNTKSKSRLGLAQPSGDDAAQRTTPRSGDIDGASSEIWQLSKTSGSGSMQAGSAIERGRAIAMEGIPKRRVPPCSECHGPGEIKRNPNYPVLAGQYAAYLVLQLTLFKKQARGGSAYAHLMDPVAAGITPQQMRDVALFYESLGRE